MAHFAELNEQNKVLRVVVISDADTSDENGIENEAIGVAFCKKLFGENTRWIQTSYNARIRKNYAGIGFDYDPVRDCFLAPKPYPSWVLDENSGQWMPPVPAPKDGKFYDWNEETTSWVEVTLE